MEQVSNPVQQFDVTVVGGGMVGSATACLLADAGLSVALIEQQLPQPFDESQPHDLRVSAISPASQQLLEQAGAWSGVLARRAAPYRHMRVWEREGFGDVMFNAEDDDQPVLGHIVENRIIQLALWDRFPLLPSLTVFSPADITQLSVNGDSNELRLASGEQIRSRLLVGADGARSPVRAAAGIGVKAHEYPQRALIAYVETAEPQQAITWQRFVPPGPQALLPLTGPHASLVWYERPDEVSRLLSLDDAAFLSALELAFPAELGDITKLLGRAAFPLRRQHALRYVKEGVALVGDAAHTIHPLAGQGVNIGFLDAEVLYEVVVEAHRQGSDFGEISVLKAYERRRRPHNQLMMSAMEMVQRGFAHTNPLAGGLRNIALAAAQRSGPVKHQVMRFAMGLEKSPSGLF